MRSVLLFTAALTTAPAALAQDAVTTSPTAVKAEVANIFSPFEGDWSCEGHLVPSGRPLASQLNFRLLSPNLMAKTHTDRAPGRYVAQEVWTATPDGALKSAVGSASGIRVFQGQHGESQGVTWDKIISGEERAERFVYAFTNPQVMTIEWWRVRDGAFAMGDTLRCEKTAPAATA